MALHPSTNIDFFTIFSGASNAAISDLYKISDDSSIPKTGQISLNNISGKTTLYNATTDFTGSVTYRNYYSSGTTGDNIIQPYSFDWGNNGTYIYLVRNGQLVRYTCGSAYDTASIVTGSKQTYNLPTTASTGDTGITYTYFAARGLTVNATGTKMLLSNWDASSGYLVELTMSTPWDLNTASLARDTSQSRVGSYWVEANGGATANNEITRTGQLQWFDSGNKFMMTCNDNSYVEVRSCPTPYSLVSSTRLSIWNAYYGGSPNQTSSLYVGSTSFATGACTFSADGYKFWVMSYASFGGSSNLYKFDLGTAWDPRTATSRTVKSAFWTTPNLSVYDMWISTDGTKMRWIYNQSGSVGDPPIVERNR